MVLSRRGLAAGLLLGAALDAVFADPRRGHPVAAFGAAASRAEAALWADSRGRGMTMVAVCLAPVAALGLAGQVGSARLAPGRLAPGQPAPMRLAAGRRANGPLARGCPSASVAVTALATWAVLGGTSLARQAQAIGRLLDDGDLAAARRRLPALCGRDPERLDAAGLARATVESVAENTSDAVVAPLLWGAVLGLPGLLGYRAVNTLDAMIGHHSPRYERFGWAAARLDDAANLIPARVTGLLAAGLAPAVGGSPRHALRMLRRDGGKHPSPNAGRCEAAFAGSLAVQLGGQNVYHGQAEQRGLLGDGGPPDAADIARAVRLSRLVSVAAAALAAVIAHLLRRGRKP